MLVLRTLWWGDTRMLLGRSPMFCCTSRELSRCSRPEYRCMTRYRTHFLVINWVDCNCNWYQFSHYTLCNKFQSFRTYNFGQMLNIVMNSLYAQILFNWCIEFSQNLKALKTKRAAVRITRKFQLHYFSWYFSPFELKIFFSC